MLTPKEASQRYLKRFIPSMTAYMLLLFGSNILIDRYDPQGAALLALAILPALPILAVIWAMGMAVIEQPDEYVRMKLVKAMLIGTAIMLAVLTVWSFLEDTGLVPEKPTHLSFPLWCIGLLIAQLWLWLRERMADARP